MERLNIRWSILLWTSLLTVPSSALAQEAGSAVETFNGLDTLWILLAAVLVFFMQAGFAMVEAGLVRAKNAANVLMKNVVDFGFAALAWKRLGQAAISCWERRAVAPGNVRASIGPRPPLPAFHIPRREVRGKMLPVAKPDRGLNPVRFAQDKCRTVAKHRQAGYVHPPWRRPQVVPRA